MRTAAPFHALRTVMVALTVLSLAAGAHALSGGALPAPGILLALLALTGLAATAATRLKLNLPVLAALLGAGQLVLHEALTGFSGHAVSAAATAPAGSVLPHHFAPVPLSADTGGQLAAAGRHAGPGIDSLLMLAGHALATLLCAVLLAKGEDALWSLAAWLRPLLRLPAAATPDAVAVPLITGWPAASAPLPRRNLRRDCRRGPPAAVVSS
ncbi:MULTISPECIES: hypothetical protein [unclassified Arthrobacter]|uniref:hypothetical protein n=1 Tax=unclassified Arthrobacter TaxID=235627 RepID=UPI002E0D75C8|nr:MULTISPECIES: hypothetical protein [unclassified Arthrobacter]